MLDLTTIDWAALLKLIIAFFQNFIVAAPV